MDEPIYYNNCMPGYLLFLELAKSDLELGFFVFECIFLSKYHLVFTRDEVSLHFGAGFFRMEIARLGRLATLYGHVKRN